MGAMDTEMERQDAVGREMGQKIERAGTETQREVETLRKDMKKKELERSRARPSCGALGRNCRWVRIWSQTVLVDSGLLSLASDLARPQESMGSTVRGRNENVGSPGHRPWHPPYLWVPAPLPKERGFKPQELTAKNS